MTKPDDTHLLLAEVQAHLLSLGDEKSKALAKKCHLQLSGSQEQETFLPMPKSFDRRNIEHWLHKGDIASWRQWCERGPVNTRLAITAFGMAAHRYGARGEKPSTWTEGLDALWNSPWASKERSKMLGEVAGGAPRRPAESIQALTSWMEHNLPLDGTEKRLLPARTRLLLAFMGNAVERGDEDGFWRLWRLGPTPTSSYASDVMQRLVWRSNKPLMQAHVAEFTYEKEKPVFPWAVSALETLVAAGCKLPLAQAASILVEEEPGSKLLDVLFSQGRGHYKESDLAQLGLMGGIRQIPEPNWKRLVAWLVAMRVPEEAQIGGGETAFSFQMRAFGNDVSLPLTWKQSNGEKMLLPFITPEEGGIRAQGGGIMQRDGADMSFSVGPYLFAREECHPHEATARLRALLVRSAIEKQADEPVARARPRM